MNPATANNDNKQALKVSLAALCGYSGFSFGDFTAKYLIQDYSLPLTLTVLSGVALMLVCIWILLDKGPRGFLSRKWKIHILRGFVAALISVSVVKAVADLPVANVYGITFSSPFVIALLAMLFLKERVQWYEWLAIALGFSGVLILLAPELTATFNMAYLYAFLALVCISLTAILTRIACKGEYLPILVFYPFLAIFVLNTPFAIDDLSMIEWEDSWLFGLYVLSIMCGFLGVLWAYASARNTTAVAPLIYVQVVWGVILGYLIFGDVPAPTTWAGLALIISGGLFMIYQERKAQSSRQSS